MAKNIHNQDLLTGDTGGTSPALGDDIGANATYTAVYVEFSAGTTAGTYVVEAARSKTYTGTWATLATIAWAAASSVKVGLIAGPWKALRVRNIVVVANGTAEVSIQVQS